MTSNTYQIEWAQPEQLTQIQQVELAAAQLFSEQDVPREMRLSACDLDDLASAQAQGRLWVALAPDKSPVGFVLVDVFDDAAHIIEIDVHPDHGRRGIGTGLIDQVCRWASGQGLTAITLTTFRHIPWNAPFYQRLGFQCLSNDQLTPGLAAILRKEASRGLDPEKRTAMRKEL